MFNKRFTEPTYRELYAAIFSPNKSKLFKPRETKTTEEVHDETTPITVKYKRQSNRPRGSINVLSACETAEEWKLTNGLLPHRYSACSPPKTTINSRAPPLINLAQPLHKTEEGNVSEDILKTYNSASQTILPKARLEQTEKNVKSTKSLEKKPRWYDMRPRLIINRYYRKNFILNFIYKRNNILTIAKVLSRPLHKKTIRTHEVFKSAVFTTETIESYNKNEQTLQIRTLKTQRTH